MSESQLNRAHINCIKSSIDHSITCIHLTVHQIHPPFSANALGHLSFFWEPSCNSFIILLKYATWMFSAAFNILSDIAAIEAAANICFFCCCSGFCCQVLMLPTIKILLLVCSLTYDLHLALTTLNFVAVKVGMKSGRQAINGCIHFQLLWKIVKLIFGFPDKL